MILLTSNGLSSEPLLEAARQKITGTKAALVVMADNVYKVDNYPMCPGSLPGPWC